MLYKFSFTFPLASFIRVFSLSLRALSLETISSTFRGNPFCFAITAARARPISQHLDPNCFQIACFSFSFFSISFHYTTTVYLSAHLPVNLSLCRGRPLSTSDNSFVINACHHLLLSVSYISSPDSEYRTDAQGVEFTFILQFIQFQPSETSLRLIQFGPPLPLPRLCLLFKSKVTSRQCRGFYLNF